MTAQTQKLTVTAREAAAMLGLHTNSIYQLVKEGRLATVKGLGLRKVVIPRIAVEALVNGTATPVVK